jgi:hypothetical protein
MELEGLFSYSQEPVSGPYADTHEFNSYSRTTIICEALNTIL